MRTTLTLDADIVEKIRAEMRRTGQSLKETVNRLLRLGLVTKRQPNAAAPFVVRPHRMGLRPGLDVDDVAGLVERIEGPLAP